MNPSTLLFILRARWLTIASVACTAILLAVIYCIFAPRIYTATTELLVDNKTQDPISGQILGSRLMSSYLATQSDIVRSRNVAKKVLEQLRLDPLLLAAYKSANGKNPAPGDAWLLYYLREGLTVTPKRETSILSISFSARDPKLAATVADAYAVAYLQTSLELRIEPAKQISQWYDEQLATLRDDLIKKQDALSEYQEKHGLISSDKLDLENAKLATLSSLLTAAQNEQLNDMSKNASKIPNNLTAQALDDPQVQKLSIDLVQAQGRLRDLDSQVGINHPHYLQAKTDVETLKQQLSRALELVNNKTRSSVELSKSREEQLKAELAAQKEHVFQLNRNLNQLRLLRQEVDSAQAAYDAALARSSQTRLESQIAQTDVAVLNTAAVPSRPTSPKIPMTLLLASVLGVLLGTALALCWEWLDRRVRSIDDLVTGLGLPVLAYIPAEHGSRMTKRLRHD
jgi:polysaccharide biosynthesis transport protein